MDLGLDQTGLCRVFVWWMGFGGAPGLIPAVGIRLLLSNLTRSDGQFPLSVPSSTLVKPISAPHF